MNTENPQPSGADRLPETETRPALPPLDDDRVAEEGQCGKQGGSERHLFEAELVRGPLRS